MERDAKEYFWGCELTQQNPTQNWSFQEEDDEDSDYLVHTLFLRNAVLGSAAVKGELNIVQVETKTFEDKDIKQPLFSLRNGVQETVTMDLSFTGAYSTTFRLVEGSGPVHVGGQHLVEFPHEGNISQDESEFFTEDDVELEDEDEDDEEESPKGKKSQKRKAVSQTAAKSKKGKMEVSAEDDEDEEEDEDDEDMDDEDDDDEDEDEEEEETPEKIKKKGKKGKDDAKGAKASKKVKPVAKGSGKKVAVKKGKK